MKRFLVLCLALWVVVFTIPLLAVKKGDATQENIAVSAIPQEADGGDGTQDVQEESTQPAESEGIDHKTKITVLQDDKVVELPLDEYLQGVVAMEMPALFPEEALKAQAVAARTEAMKHASTTPPESHKGAMLCDSPAHCMAYEPLSTAANNWGISKDLYSNKIKKAVSDTDGVILLYDNEPISAVFHAASAGKTERAVDVWGGDVPYLQSVESPGETDSPSYYGRVEMKPEEFKSAFLEKHKDANLSGDPGTWFKNSTRSEAGGVIKVYVGGVQVSGNEIRSLCELRSTNFTVQYKDGKLVFDTKGYGHCVGMSQYGARAMAQQGKGYEEILSWYYQGVSFGKIQA